MSELMDMLPEMALALYFYRLKAATTCWLTLSTVLSPEISTNTPRSR